MVYSVTRALVSYQILKGEDMMYSRRSDIKAEFTYTSLYAYKYSSDAACTQTHVLSIRTRT